MSYSHSSKGAFQLWADTVDDPSYTYENVVSYYRKSMDFTPPDDETRLANATPLYDPADTVKGGPLSVTYPSFAISWSTWVAKGMEALGILKTNAFINGNLNGSSWLLETINPRKSFRASAESAYLLPYLNRPNLFLFDWTLAERIIFNSRQVATGVEVTTAQTTYTLSASKEVIVSAGTFQSPQLLLVSGVGPAALLHQHNITVVADRQGVGQGMQDHVILPITYEVNLAIDPNVTAQDIYEFNAYGVGRLANPGGDYVGFEKIPVALRANFSAETVQGKWRF
jgi:choline dehydrogenase